MTREQVMVKVIAALQQIKIANGYNTNAGDRVYRYPVGLHQLTDGDFPCVVATDAFQPDRIESTFREKDIVRLPLDIFGLDSTSADWRTGDLPTRINNLRADLKKALTTDAVFATKGEGSLRRLGAEPIYDADDPFGLVPMRIELSFAED